MNRKVNIITISFKNIIIPYITAFELSFYRSFITHFYKFFFILDILLCMLSKEDPYTYFLPCTEDTFLFQRSLTDETFFVLRKFT